MFTKSRPYPEWKALTEKTCDLPWGTLVEYRDIEAWMGLKRNDPRFSNNIQRWKKEMLQEYQRPLVALKNEGYRILGFEEIAPRAKHMVRLGARRMGKGVSIAENAPFDDMPDAERRAVVDFGVRAGMLVQMCREKLRELKLKSGVESPTPRVLKGSK